MIQFTVLNPLVVEQVKDVSHEIKVERALDLYNQSLILLQKGRVDEAQSTLEDLLGRDVMRDNLPPGGIGAHSSPTHSLHYVVHKNYAILLEKQGMVEKALSHYRLASKVDPSDPALWCKLGFIASRLGMWDEACHFYLRASERTRMRSLKFTCLDGIINALYQFGDYASCLVYIRKALDLDKNYPRGLWIRRQIIEESLCSLPMTCAPLLTDFTFEEMMAHLTILPVRTGIQVRNSRCQPASGHANVNHDVTTICLEDLTFFGLGTLLFDTYRAWLQSCPKKARPPSDVCGQIRIEVRVNAPSVPRESMEPECVEGIRMMAACDDLSGEINADKQDVVREILETEDDNMQVSKKRRNSESEDPRRSSKRVRSRMETEQQQKEVAYKDLAEIANELFPAELDFCECGELLVGKMDVFISGFLARILAVGQGDDPRRNKGTELICDAWLSERFQDHLSAFGDDELGAEDLEGENPLNRLSIFHILQRCCSAIGELLADEDTGGDVQIIRRVPMISAVTNDTGGQPFRVTLLNCYLDSEISLASLDQKLAAADARIYVLEAREKFENKQYAQVVERLKPVFVVPQKNENEGPDSEAVRIAKSFINESCPFSTRYKLLNSLQLNLGDIETAFMCSVLSLIDAVPRITIELDLESHLEIIADAAGHCLDFMEASKEWPRTLCQHLGHTVTPSRTLFEEFAAAISASMHLTWAYMKCHMEKPSASKRTAVARRLRALNALAVRNWVLMYHSMRAMGGNCVSQAALSDRNGESNESAEPRAAHSDGLALESVSVTNTHALSELLFIAHEELGKRALCGMDDGRLLKLILRRRGTAETDADRAETYQCYACLYNLRIDHGIELADHATTPVAFDQAAASDVFDTVSGLIRTLLAQKGGRGLPADVKQCLDKVTEMYSRPPWENAKIQFNKEAIESFLNGPLDVLDMSPKKRASLAWLDFSEKEKNRIPTVYFNLFFLQGRLAYAQYKARSGQNYYVTTFYKSVDLLQSATTHFLFDLHLNPERLESWLHLAFCYAALANEHLSNNAELLVQNFDQIWHWQKRAFHCFVQAKHFYSKTKVDPNKTATLDAASSLWGEFGLLCHAISSNPMSGAALMSNMHHVRAVWRARLQAFQNIRVPLEVHSDLPTATASEPQQGPMIPGKFRAVLGLGAYCFKKAAAMKPDWAYPYMLANIYAKLGAETAIVINYYRRAVSLVPAEWSTKEQERILDPMLKLIGYLSKGLHRNELDSETVIAALTGLNDRANIICKTAMDGFADAAERDARKRAVRSMIVILTHMKGLNMWHHKPAYRHAWLAYYELRDPVQAQQILSTLFKLKDEKSRKFVNFWKPEFERPGKHFMSVHKYIIFLTKLMEENSDIDGLRRLCRKVRKADDVLLWPDRIWKVVYTACFGALQAGANAALNAASSVRRPSDLLEIMSKYDFDRRAPAVERRIFAAADQKPAELQSLLCAFELKKLNDGLLDETELEQFLVEMYGALFADFSCGNGEDDNTYGDASERIRDKSDAEATTPEAENSLTGPKIGFDDVLERVYRCCKNPPQIQRDSKLDLPIESAIAESITADEDSRTASTDPAKALAISRLIEV
ncbi:Histone transcription regulator 3 [Geranomyces variabilis]|nr:Histone transcription regulator 3 [Geranomyces variabilis]